MTELPEISDELDKSIKEYLETIVSNEEMVTEYFILAATRTLDNGGQTFITTKVGIPSYIVEGMLRRALWLIN